MVESELRTVFLAGELDLHTNPRSAEALGDGTDGRSVVGTDTGTKAIPPEAGLGGLVRAPTDRCEIFLLAAGNGDQAAVADLYDQIIAQVSAIMTLVGADPDPDNATAQALIEIGRTAPNYRHHAGPARSWCLNIAYRRAIRSHHHNSHTNTVASDQPLDTGKEAEAYAAPVQGGVTHLRQIERSVSGAPPPGAPEPLEPNGTNQSRPQHDHLDG